GADALIGGGDLESGRVGHGFVNGQAHEHGIASDRADDFDLEVAVGDVAAIAAVFGPLRELKLGAKAHPGSGVLNFDVERSQDVGFVLRQPEAGVIIAVGEAGLGDREAARFAGTVRAVNFDTHRLHIGGSVAY